jgi:hypothetical protein
MVDAPASIALEAVSPIFPEGVNSLIRMKVTDWIRPAVFDEVRIGVADRRAVKRVMDPTLWFVHVEPGRHDIEVANQEGGNV